MTLNRRDFIKTSVGAAGLAATAGLAGCATTRTGSAGPKVVVVGAGFGGATFSRYLKLWAPQAQVTLIEPNAHSRRARSPTRCWPASTKWTTSLCRTTI